jgi:recombination protein RecR
MSILPKSLQATIEALSTLPGVGTRSAERYAYHLLRTDSINSERLAGTLQNLHNGVKYCPITFALIDASEDVSSLYSDPKRNKKIIAVVEDAFDIVAIEKTNQFHGTYHVLGGLISPIDGVSPESLHITELVERVKKDKVTEVILATSSSVEGESTAHYISKMLERHKCSVTRLARGLPVGLDLEYADQITLGKAFEGRRSL